jgi:hypothetical protein
MQGVMARLLPRPARIDHDQDSDDLPPPGIRRVVACQVTPQHRRVYISKISSRCAFFDQHIICGAVASVFLVLHQTEGPLPTLSLPIQTSSTTPKCNQLKVCQSSRMYDKACGKVVVAVYYESSFLCALN